MSNKDIAFVVAIAVALLIVGVRLGTIIEQGNNDSPSDDTHQSIEACNYLAEQSGQHSYSEWAAIMATAEHIASTVNGPSNVRRAAKVARISFEHLEMVVATGGEANHAIAQAATNRVENACKGI